MNAVCNGSYTSGIREFQYVVIGSAKKSMRFLILMPSISPVIKSDSVSTSFG